uniref:Uncharacterized protein n=1 Tax=Arundo donax TaxID=35708 RepID=A0A0A9BPR5_ARUDO
MKILLPMAAKNMPTCSPGDSNRTAGGGLWRCQQRQH